MKHISSTKAVNTFSPDAEPIAMIESGEIFSLDTLDCFGNNIGNEGQTLSSLPWESINPCTGPIMINGAHIGDTLKIDVIDIKPGNRGIVIKDRGDLDRYNISEPEKSIIVDITDNEYIVYKDKKYNIHPMIGVIGVLSDKDALTTLPGINGGNMDSTAITTGSSLYLPVINEGAGLVVGDLHAAMGDGETTGCGIETSGSVILKTTIINDNSIPLPFVETEGKYITIASAETLEEAISIAIRNMRKYLIENKHLESDEAWVLMTVALNVRICQIANRLKTVRCELLKQLI